MALVKEHASEHAIYHVGQPVMEGVLVVQWLGVAIHAENHVRATVQIVVKIHVIRIVQLPVQEDAVLPALLIVHHV